MSVIITLISAVRYIDLPQGPIAWSGLIALIALNLFLQIYWRGYNRKFSGGQWLLLVALLVLTPLTSLFLGFRLPTSGGLPPVGIPQLPLVPAAMIFGAVPWVLAGGMLGPLPAALLALLHGLLMAFYQTHSPFTPFELALLGAVFSTAVRQSYRTPTYRVLRRPPAAAVLAAGIFVLVHLTMTPLFSKGLLVTRIDYAMTNLSGMTQVMLIELLIAGVLAEVVALLWPGSWYKPDALQPSPAERSLRMRFIISMAPLAAILVAALIAGDWLVANNVARDLLHTQMVGAAEMASGGVPYFLETGQSLIQDLAGEPALVNAGPQELELLLQDFLRRTPFFNQLTVLDTSGAAIISYPTRFNVGKDAPIDIQMGVQAVFNGFPFQAYSVPPAVGQTSAQVAFISAITTADGETPRVLVGHSDLGTNPLIQPALTGLASLAGIDGQGFLIDENKRILAHPNPQRIWEYYTGPTTTEAGFFDDISADGTRQAVYVLPAPGAPWSVVVNVPARRVQQIAVNIALPLLAVLVLLGILAAVVVRLTLGVITRSLQNLAGEAGRLAEGRLDRPVLSTGTDEVGQLSRAFEQMRAGLKARMDDLNRLLTVSQGVASSLEIAEAVQPVLEAALSSGAAAARIVLIQTAMPELSGETLTPISYGAGPSHKAYQYMDEQLLALTRQQDRLVLSNLYRPRLINFTPGSARPESLLAVALKHENQYYGALWVAYTDPHTFSEDEVRFMATLAGQAALAAANARLFMNAEIGRKRLELILASTPDPVLVTDQRDCLLLANPAAWQVLGLGMDRSEGRPIDQVIKDSALLDLLRNKNPDKQSVEVLLPGGRVYLASATSVLAEGRRVGRVSVLRDVTHFKELDALKSEFVSTVSHDLRSPLTLMRGYATMLDMVGQLNEQQVGYVNKIVTGVETMARLVNNLLDLGRIDAGVGLQPEPVAVVEVVERVVGAMQAQAAQKHITLTHEFPAGSKPIIEADPALLQQAVQNLVENALKFTRAEGRVLVRLQLQPSAVLIQVIDNGIGISPMDMPRLFEKFYRGVHGTKEIERRGTGLGLAIVRSIAERHGGRVWAESQLGRGSAFYLSLPVKQAVKKAPEKVEKSAN